MLYLLAAVGAVTIGVVLWKLLRMNDPTRTDQFVLPQEREEEQAQPQQQGRVIGPDDDPEFLRSLDKYRND
ncbi:MULTISPECIES: hypothetical protein [Sciscionella]|uniref:hypothetical protein n=1 Tax=Sciscionella TaxID=596495 RepID=UPI000367C20C|nr:MULTISPECIES: hypothetical protein [Sciscionella]